MAAAGWERRRWLLKMARVLWMQKANMAKPAYGSPRCLGSDADVSPLVRLTSIVSLEHFVQGLCMLQNHHRHATLRTTATRPLPGHASRGGRPTMIGRTATTLLRSQLREGVLHSQMKNTETREWSFANCLFWALSSAYTLSRYAEHAITAV